MKHQPVIYKTVYDRAAVTVGIVHVGYGAFHRAHQAVYLDDYMQISGDLRWGIGAINLRASESDAFTAAQRSGDGYLVKTTAPDGNRSFRTVRAHQEFADWAEDAAAAEELVADEVDAEDDHQQLKPPRLIDHLPRDRCPKIIFNECGVGHGDPK